MDEVAKKNLDDFNISIKCQADTLCKVARDKGLRSPDVAYEIGRLDVLCRIRERFCHNNFTLEVPYL